MKLSFALLLALALSACPEPSKRLPAEPPAGAGGSGAAAEPPPSGPVHSGLQCHYSDGSASPAANAASSDCSVKYCFNLGYCAGAQAMLFCKALEGGACPSADVCKDDSPITGQDPFSMGIRRLASCNGEDAGGAIPYPPGYGGDDVPYPPGHGGASNSKGQAGQKKGKADPDLMPPDHPG